MIKYYNLLLLLFIGTIFISPILSCTCKFSTCKVYITTNGSDTGNCGNDYTSGCQTLAGAITACAAIPDAQQYYSFYYGNGTWEITDTIQFGVLSYSFYGQGNNNTIFDFKNLTPGSSGFTWNTIFPNNADNNLYNITLTNFDGSDNVPLFDVQQNGDNFTTLSFQDCTFDNNQGPLFIVASTNSYYMESVGPYVTLRFYTCTFTNNVNTGIQTTYTYVIMDSSTFTNNIASNSLIYVNGGGFKLSNSDFNGTEVQGSFGLIYGFNQTSTKINNLVFFGLVISSSTFENNYFVPTNNNHQIQPTCSIIYTEMSYVKIDQSIIKNNTLGSIFNLNDIVPFSDINTISSTDIIGNMISYNAFYIANSETQITYQNQILSNTFVTHNSVFNILSTTQEIVISGINVTSNIGQSEIFSFYNSTNISITNFSLGDNTKSNFTFCTGSSVVFENITIQTPANDDTNQVVTCSQCTLSSNNDQISNCTIPKPPNTVDSSSTEAAPPKTLNPKKPNYIVPVILSIIGALIFVGIIVFLVQRFKHKIFKHHHHHHEHSPLIE